MMFYMIFALLLIWTGHLNVQRDGPYFGIYLASLLELLIELAIFANWIFK